MGTRYANHLMALTTESFLICQMIVLTKTFIPYEQFDLDIILKVTVAVDNMNLADLKCGTNLLKARHQAILGVLLFAFVGSVNMD